MARNMSFRLTTRQFLDGTKTVNRRFGWWFLKPGDIIMGVVQSQWRKRGQKIVRLGLIRIVSVRREPLNMITRAELVLEGMPDTRPRDFVQMMCDLHRVPVFQTVNRIAFEYLD